MLTALLLHGALFVGFVCVYGRWLDEELTADVCLFGLLVELCVALAISKYAHALDALFYLHAGSPITLPELVHIDLVLCFDEIGGFFLAILSLALIVCFFFLIEYFEFDANAGTIVTLSALFSQTALLYFASFDLCLVLFFWELISLISFLLVQHWAFRVSSYKAGLKVFTVSQLGDLPFFFFIFLTLARVHHTDVAVLLPLLPLLAFDYVLCGPVCCHLLSLLGVCLQVAIFLKAAQWFFYPWLLDAMEAPVPISAQLHSSTLVVIGFYLFFRFQALFLLAPVTATLALAAGLSTSVGASVLGFFQEDGKKLLACSTASQLGYVLVALGLHLFSEALYLLTFCCCNKAATFVWFGVFMRRHSGVSDFRLVGGQGLTWVEHAGLVAAIANFTVAPGAFCWHVKGLFGHGTCAATGVGVTTSVALLQVTWFFSSLYLVNLYVMLFLGARRHSTRKLSLGALPALAGVRLNLWSQPALPWAQPGSYRVRGILLLAQFALVWYGGAWGLFSCDTFAVESVFSLYRGYY